MSRRNSRLIVCDPNTIRLLRVRVRVREMVSDRRDGILFLLALATSDMCQILSGVLVEFPWPSSVKHVAGAILLYLIFFVYFAEVTDLGMHGEGFVLRYFTALLCLGSNLDVSHRSEFGWVEFLFWGVYGCGNAFLTRRKCRMVVPLKQFVFGNMRVVASGTKSPIVKAVFAFLNISIAPLANHRRPPACLYSFPCVRP